MGSAHSAALESAEKGDVTAIKKLLQRRDAKEWLNKEDKEDGNTPLLKACINGHLEVAKLLVSSGANINSTDKDGNTPLLKACIKGRLEVAKLLVSKGANINSTDKDGNTPLLKACIKLNKINCHLEVVQLLVSSGANINCTNKSGWTPLRSACYKGHLEVAKLLVSSGANVNCTYEGGKTPFHWACMYGHLEVVKLLVSKGANINCTDNYRWTPLHYSCFNGHLEVAKLLVSSGANINRTDNYRWTPLHYACFNGHLEVVKLLVSKGANINCTDKDGWTPLLKACTNGHLEVAKLLVSKGANINSTDNDGWTPLLKACTNGHLEVVKLLLEAGADAAKRDKSGKLPLDYVSDKTKKAEVSRLLGSIFPKKELLKEGRAELEERQEKEETAARQSEAEGLKLEADGEMYGGDLEKAVSLYSQCILNYSDSTVAMAALSNRSLAFLKLKMNDKATDDASAVLSEDPHNVEALYRRALAHEGASRFDKAVDDLDEVLKISPDNELAAEARSRVVQVRESLQLKLWGNESYREGNYETAVKHYSKAIRLDSRNATLYNNRAQAYLKAAQYLNAEADASQVISSGHRDGLLKAFHRRALARQGINTAESLQGALDDINRVMSSNPENKKAVSEKQKIETALLELEAKKQREKEETAARLKEAEGLKLKADGEMYGGDLEKAVSLYSRCISNYSDSTVAMAALSNRSLAFLKLKMNDKATDDASAVLSEDPHNVEALYRRALAHEGASRFDKAVDDLDEVLKISPDNELAAEARSRVVQVRESLQLKLWGNESYREGDYETAVKHYSKAIRLDSRNATLYNNRAQAYLKAAQYLNAEADASQVISSGHRDGLLKAFHRRALARQGINTAESLQGALDDINRVMSSNPENKEAVSEKQKIETALLELEAKKQREKEETAARLKEAEGLKLKADGEMYGGDLEKAVSLYSQCISNYSDSTVAMAALSNRSLAFLKLKMNDKATDDASAVLSQDPHNVEALYRRALAHEGASRFDKAVDDLDEVLKISPDNELAAEARSRVVQVKESLQLKLWGNESYREGDYETAVKHYSKAIRLDSSNATLYNNRAQAYLKTAQYLNAEADASQVISSGHRDGLLKAFHRRALARQGINTAESLQGALDDINRVMSSNPENKEAVTEKQKIETALLELEAKKQQEKEEAAARLKEAEGLKLKADGEMYGGDLEKAVSLYSQCILNYSDSTVAMAALSNRSLAFLKLKMYDKATDDASAVLSEDPHNVEALYRRALAHEGASRFDKAVDDLDEVLKISPDNELAAEARSRVVQVKESLQLKLWGNESYREGDYETAVKHYSEAIRLDSSNATLYNNRAQAYLKTAQYLNAEADASQVISSGDRDGLLKAFHRRALARQGINTAESLQGALDDINRVMSSNPENKEAVTEKQKIETALLELEAKKQREKEETAARLKEAEAQVLVGREILDLFNARLMNLDSDDHKKLLTHQQRQGAEISHVREVLDSIDDKLKCLSPVDREEQRLIRTTPVLSEYMQALQRHTHESLLIADALSAGLLDQTANLESDAVEVKAFRVLAKLCSGLPLIPTVLFGVAGGLNYLHQAKEKGGYSILLKLVSGGPVERSLFVEKLSRALTVTLMNDIIATENAKHDSNSKESTQCFLDKVKGVVRKMKDMAREKVAALDEALAEGLLSSQTKAELMACGHVTDLLEHVFAGELRGAEGDEEEVVARLVRHVAGSERVRLEVSTKVVVSSSTGASLVDLTDRSFEGSSQQLNVAELEFRINELALKLVRLEKENAELKKDNKRIGEKAERSEQTMNRVFQHVVTGEGQQVRGAIQTRTGARIELADSQAEMRLAEVSTAQMCIEEAVQSIMEEMQCLKEDVARLKKSK